MSDDETAIAVRPKVRRDILQLLCQKEKLPVHKIKDFLGITESTASRHLKLLYHLGFVDFEIKAPEKFFFLKIRTKKEIEAFLRVYNNIAKQIETSYKQWAIFEMEKKGDI